MVTPWPGSTLDGWRTNSQASQSAAPARRSRSTRHAPVPESLSFKRRSEAGMLTVRVGAKQNVAGAWGAGVREEREEIRQRVSRVAWYPCEITEMALREQRYV